MERSIINNAVLQISTQLQIKDFQRHKGSDYSIRNIICNLIHMDYLILLLLLWTFLSDWINQKNVWRCVFSWIEITNRNWALVFLYLWHLKKVYRKTSNSDRGFNYSKSLFGRKKIFRFAHISDIFKNYKTIWYSMFQGDPKVPKNARKDQK